MRNLALHQAALTKLPSHPELMASVLGLLDRWLGDEGLASSRIYFQKWRDLLASTPFPEMAKTILDPERGQGLRQCSPLGPVLTPQERWAVFREWDESLSSQNLEAQR